MTTYIDSFYSRTAEPHEPWPVLRGDRETEVCVIGGGLAGLSGAVSLAERGLTVTLLEARRIAWGASGRNGGFVSPGFSLGSGALTKRLGLERARQLYALSDKAVALVRNRIARYEIAGCEPVEGRISVWRYPDPDEIRRECDRMAEQFGIEGEVWSREELRERLLTERYHGGLFDRAGFHFHPLNYALGLARAAASLGVRLHEGSEVTGLALETAQKTVTTAQGVVRARELVIACGGLIGGLQRRLSAATLPIATYVVATEPLGDRLQSAIRLDCAIHDNRLANDYYRVVAGDRILWGGRISARRAEPAELAALMLGDLVSVYPQLAGLRAETAWAGTMGYARHKMPQIGILRPGVWYSMGFGGHGMNTTAMAGELIAAAIAERDDHYRLFAPFGLAWTGGALGPVAAQTTYWAYQLGDWFRERRKG